METDTKMLTKLDIQPDNHCSLKIFQPIYIDQIGCIALGRFLWQKTSQCRHFKVKFKQTSVVLDFSKLPFDEN